MGMFSQKMGMDIPLEKMEATNDEKIGSLAAAYRGSSDKGECASKVCKDLEEKTECGLSKIFSSGREWCYKCEKYGYKRDGSDLPKLRCLDKGGNWAYCDSTC